MSVSVRVWLEAQLKPLLPTTWRIAPGQSLPSTIDRITVVLKHVEIERLAEAPIGHLRHHILLAIADPHENQVTAENALDASVLTLCTALDGLPGLNWTGAKKVLMKDPYLGWDITLTVLSNP